METKSDSISCIIKEYFNDTYLFSSTATLLSTGIDTKGPFLVFDSTIFHPQGGGQPSDIGMVIDENGKETLITFVASCDGVIKHYTTEEPSYLINTKFILKIDQNRRIINAKAHTAGHFLEGIIMTLEPDLIKKKGYHFPEGPNVEFIGKELSMPRNELAARIEEIAKKMIQEGREVIVTEDKTKEGKTRFVQIKGFESIPCGGTHLSNINELSELKIRKIVKSNGDLKFCYSC